MEEKQLGEIADRIADKRVEDFNLSGDKERSDRFNEQKELEFKSAEDFYSKSSSKQKIMFDGETDPKDFTQFKYFKDRLILSNGNKLNVYDCEKLSHL